MSPKKRARRACEALAFPAYYTAFYLCRYSVLPMAPLIAREWGVGYDELGLSISLLYAGYFVSLLVAGPAASLLGVTRTLVLSSSLTALVNLAIVPAGKALMPQLLLVNGLAQGLAWPSLTQLAASRSKERAYYLMGSMLTAASIAPLLVFTSASAFIELSNWTLFFPFTATVMALATLAFVPSRAAATAGKGGVSAALRRRDVWLLALAYFFFYALVRGLISWLPSLLVELDGAPPSLAAAASGLVSAASAASGVIGALLAKRAAKPWAVITASFALSLAVLATGAALHPSATLIALSLIALSLSGWLFFAIPAETLPQHAVATASGLIDALGYLGSSISTWLLSASIAQGYKYLFTLASTLAAAGLIPCAAALREKPTQQVALRVTRAN